MVFANPSYLWALLGLLVPLAIHLWSKKEAKTIKIGSIQLMDESNSRQSSNIQLNELLLLLLRMLIVALVVVLMAGPKWRTKATKKKVTYLVEATLANDTSISTLLDSVQEHSPVLVLENGFSEWDANTDYGTKETQPNYWQLVPKMDSLRSDSLVVFTKALKKGFRSMRPNTQKKIHWVVMNPEETQSQPLMALMRDSGVELVTASSTSSAMQIKRQPLVDGFEIIAEGDSLRLLSDASQIIALRKLDTLHINMFVEKEFEREGSYIEASFKALSTFLKQEIRIHKQGDSMSNQADLNIVLGTAQNGQSDGKQLVYQENPLADELIESGKEKNVFYLTSRLNPKNTLEQRLPEQLLQILDLEEDVKNLLASADVRQLDESQLRPNYVEPKRKRERASFLDISLWVFGILAVLMIVERVLSNYKKQ